jgi:lipoprotein-releasing system ATP-binding protein
VGITPALLGWEAARIRKAVDALLEMVELDPAQVRDRLPDALSGGQAQRVAVARALAMKPALLLADEPTGNLDTQSADAVFELLRTVNREHGTAILFVTHNAALAARCDAIVRVVDGRIVEPAAAAT